MDIKGSYLSVADDVVLIEEKEENWFKETGSLDVGGSGCTVHGNVKLTEGAPVLILETNGDLHGFYAAAGSNDSTLVLGEPMNAYRGITHAHYQSGDVAVVGDDGVGYDFGPSFPLPPVSARWGNENKNWFSTDIFEGKGYLHFNFDADYGFLWLELDADDISLEFAYKNNQVHLEEENDWAYSIPLFTVQGSLADVLNVGADTFISFEGGGKGGDTHFDTNIKEGYYLGLKFSASDGIECTKVGWIDDRNFDVTETNAKGEFYTAYGEGIFGNIFDMLGLESDYKAGFVINGDTAKNHVYPGEPDVWHACDDDQCICGDSHVRIGPLSLNATVLDFWSKTLAHTDPYDLDPFMNYYVSETFGDKNMRGKCPHKGYKINADGDALSNAAVAYKDIPSHFDPVSSGKTGDDGKTTLYAPTGDYQVTAELVSPEYPSKKVSQTLPLTKDTSIQDMKFTLDIPTKHVYFKNAETGQATDWPKDMDFKPFYSEDVKLPDNIPSLSGRVFIGWNTKKDGSGTSYAPGATIKTDDDVTLWAQWKKAENSWFVQYNANGGTKAPVGQVVAKGEDAVLSMEVPENGKMIFKGWALDPRGPSPDYQRGDTLPYDSEKAYVVLYALWDISPVTKPVHISFDANGVDGASLPADLWFERGTWAQLSPAYPPQGSPYLFKGWSEDPKATEPEYKAGTTYYFDRDTALYAIWDRQEEVTLTFKDSLPGGSSGIPDPISIRPSMSRDVLIPSVIPEKGGMQFVEWNTNPDGSGTHYAPGSVITLMGNTTLWAQWKKAENSWFVQYNANGGTKAPVGQAVEKGEDAVLSMEVPENGKMIFKGWALDPRGPSPDYQRGDTLPYDSEKSYVVLYALWEISPVTKPIHITFDANGMKEASLPADLWFERGTWAQLNPAYPPLGSPYLFKGWSEDPKATEPEYKAGTPYYFFRDTTLYAIWDQRDKLTLSFKDPLPGESSGIPDPITIWPSMSRYVRIPDVIPQKDGMQFTGWNTKQDGSGTRYVPGSAITMMEDTTLWAYWKNIYTITYNLNGGTYNGSGDDITESYVDGTEITVHEAPTREGYTFVCWKGSEYQPGDKYTVVDNHTLTAQWKKNENPVNPDTSSGFPTIGDETKTLLGFMLFCAAFFAVIRVILSREDS